MARRDPRRPFDAKKAAARSLAAKRANETRRLAGYVRPTGDPVIGRKTNYAKLSTSTLLSFLAGEQCYIDEFIGGQQVHFARERLESIEAILVGRNVDQSEINAHRFGISDCDDHAAVVERFAIEREADSYFAGFAHFAPEDYAA